MIRFVCVACGRGVTDPTGDWTHTHIEYYKCEKCVNRELNEAVSKLRKETPNDVSKLQDGHRTS